MVVTQVVADGLDANALEGAVRAVVTSAPADAVLTVRVVGELTDAGLRAVSAARLRTFVPPTMNVEIRPADGYARERRPSRPAPLSVVL
jgi:hypothetical protein